MKRKTPCEKSFCQRLIKSLDSPSLRKKLVNPKSQSKAAILELPTEIRQQILCSTVDDDDLFYLDLHQHANSLSKVCSVFLVDMPYVLGQWEARRTALKSQSGWSFQSYIDDLLNAAHLDKSSGVKRHSSPHGQASSRKAGRRFRSEYLYVQQQITESVVTRTRQIADELAVAKEQRELDSQSLLTARKTREWGEAKKIRRTIKEEDGKIKRLRAKLHDQEKWAASLASANTRRGKSARRKARLGRL